MATTYRSTGANARAQRWEEEESASKRANWLPLEDLEDELFTGTPQLRSMPSQPSRAFPQVHPQPERLRPTQPQPVARKKQGSQVEARKNDASKAQVRAMAILAGAVLCAFMLYITVSALLEWAQVKLDDFQYGRPRTVQMDAYVGHAEAEGVPSHFIAMNLNRRVTIMELPGGDSTKANTIVGPYLFGQGEDLTPVQLNAQDVNADTHPDLVVTVKSEQLIYLNDGTTFRLMTPEERIALQRAQVPPIQPGAAQEAGK